MWGFYSGWGLLINFGRWFGCIDSIYTQDEVFSHKDHTPAELENFVEQLSPDFFKKIINFFETMPNMKNELTCKCPFCKEETKIVVRGLEDFFI